MAISFEDFIKQSGGNKKDIKLVDNSSISQAIPEEKFGYGFGTNKMTAEEFLAQPKAKQYFQAFVATLPKDVYDFFVKQPEQFVRSVAEVPQTVLSGGQNVPDYGGTISDASKALKGGAKPFGWEAMAKPELKTLSSGLATAQAGNLAVKGIQKATPIVQKGISNVGTGLKGAGEGVYGITVTKEEPTVNALINYDKNQPTLIQRLFGAKSVGNKPITEANTAARKGLVGTEYGIGVQAAKAQDKVFETIAPKLDQTKKAVYMPDFISGLQKEIQKIPGLSERHNLLEGLSKFKEDYRNVGWVGGTKLQQYKQDWARFITDATYKGKPIANSLKAVFNLAAEKSRPILYNIVGEGGKQAYIDYGNLQSIVDAAKKAGQQNIRNRGITYNVWQTLMDKAITPIATLGGKVLYKTGEGLEFVGKIGAKKVGDIIK